MNQLLSFVVNGLSVGAIYALVAIGIVLIFKAGGVVTFTHGSLLLLGTYVAARIGQDQPFVVGVIAGLTVTAVAAVAVERLVINRMSGAPVVSLAIVTIGVDVILITFLTQEIGSELLNINHPWGGSTMHLGGAGFSANRAIALLTALVILATFYAAFRYTSWGIAMRAVAEDGETAELMGIRLGRVTAVSWLLAGALAAIAGIFLVGSPTPGVTISLAAIALHAFPAAILGGLDSVTGALVGGLVIGVIEALVDGYQDHFMFLGRGLGDLAPFIVMIAVLLIRPSGIFGTKEMTRV